MDDQLSENFRKVKQVESVLHDRFDSLMSRGQVEVPWDADTLRKSEKGKPGVKGRLKKRNYTRSTGIDRFFPSSSGGQIEKKKDGIFY